MGATREPVDIEFVLKGDLEKEIEKVNKSVKSLGTEGDVSYKKIKSSSSEAFSALSKDAQAQAVALQNTIVSLKKVEHWQDVLKNKFESGGMGAKEYAQKMADLSTQSATLKSTAAGLSSQIQHEITLNQLVAGSYNEKIAKINELKKAYKDLSVEEMENENVGQKMITQLKELEKETEKISESLKDVSGIPKPVSTSIDGLKAKLSELQKQYNLLSEEERNNKAVGGEMVKNIKAVDSELKKLSETFKEVPGIPKPVSSSIDGLKAKLTGLQKQYNLLSEKERNSKIGKSLSKEMKSLSGDISKAEASNKGFVKSLEEAPGVIGQTVGGVKQLIVASLKFIATPVGAIIAAVVVALKLLTTWFHRSAEGESAMITASAYFTQIMDSLLNVVAKAGEWMYKAITKPKEAMVELVDFMKNNLINRLFGLGNIFISLKDIAVNSFKLIKASIENIWSDQSDAIRELKEGLKTAALDWGNAYAQVLTGIENPIDKLIATTKEIDEKAKKRAVIAKQLYDLDLQDLETKKEVAKAEVKIAELREKAKDNNNDQRERLRLIQEAQKLTASVAQKEIDELQKRYDLTKAQFFLENGVTDINKLIIDDQRALNELELSILQKQEEKSNKLRTLLDQQNAINGKIFQEKTAHDLVTKELDLKKQAYQTYYRFIAATDKAYANERFADLVAGGESYLEYINRRIAELKANANRSKSEDTEIGVLQGEKMELMGTSNPVDVLRREMEAKKMLYGEDLEAYEKYLEDKKALLEGDDTEAGYSLRTVVDAELTDANLAVQKNLDELVTKYQTYTLQVTSLEKDYQRDITRLRAELSNQNSKYSQSDIEEAMKARTEAYKAAIAKLTAEDSEFFQTLSGNLERISKKSIDAAIAKAKTFLNKYKDAQGKWLKDIDADTMQLLVKKQEDIAKAEDESETRLPENIQKVAAGLKDAASMAALFDDELGAVINTAAEVASGIANVAKGVATIGTDPVGGVTSIISGLGSVISAIKKQSDAAKEAAEAFELQSMRSYVYAFEYNQLLRERARITQQIGESTTKYNERITDELLKQKQKNQAEYSTLLAKIHSEDISLISASARRDWSTIQTLAGKTFEDIEKLYDLDQLTDKAKLLFEQLQELKDEGEDINTMLAEQAEAMREALTGTTSDAITDAIVSGFENGYKSATDFADTFQDLMKKAMLQALKLQVLEEPIRQWYEAFAASMQAGTLDSDMAALNGQWESIIANASDWMSAAEQATGLTFGDSSQSATAGAITTITEATGSKLEGHFVAVRVNTGKLVESVASIQSRMIKQVEHLAKIEENTNELKRLEKMESVLTRLENDGIKIKS